MKLALGTAQFGLNYGISNTAGKVSDHELQQILRVAADKGITLLDTAQAYGDAESRLGQFISNNFQVISKLAPGTTAATARTAVLHSLNQLKQPNLYGLMLHRTQDYSAELWQKLQSMQAAGLVGKLGISVYTPEELDEFFRSVPEFERMLVDDGILLFKYWLCCDQDRQEKRFAERRDALLRLDVELQTAGALGLDEQRAEVARDLAQAQRRRAELARRAGALDHLLGLLQTRRKALTRRLQAPLKRHLDHYLHLLFPDASLEIDERLQPGALTRRGPNGSAGTETGPFDALSFGAREQMGVISRLAYADLLKEAGRPTLIILDDALVHSDAERLAQMKRVLFDAATRHQILLFSCHPEDWRDLGVSARSLENLRNLP